jgi:mannose-6-phosphate isomerase-like protein (cupin superfamily)
MQQFDLSSLLAEREKSGRAWFEFLRHPALSMGVYHLNAGQRDPQLPHSEDEVYVVLHGRAQFLAGGERREVGPGSVLFVGKLVEHRFDEIAEDLTALVFFAPAEGSLAAP